MPRKSLNLNGNAQYVRLSTSMNPQRDHLLWTRDKRLDEEYKRNLWHSHPCHANESRRLGRPATFSSMNMLRPEIVIGLLTSRSSGGLATLTRLTPSKRRSAIRFEILAATQWWLS